MKSNAGAITWHAAERQCCDSPGGAAADSKCCQADNCPAAAALPHLTHLWQGRRYGLKLAAGQQREALVLPSRPVVHPVSRQEVARPGVAPPAEGLQRWEHRGGRKTGTARKQGGQGGVG